MAAKKTPTVKSVNAGTTVTNCTFQNTTHFDPEAVEAVSRIADALKANAEAAIVLAKIFTQPGTPFNSMLSVESPAQPPRDT